jgi:ABC-type multidrug transport system fused ATPase/permease subunit
MFLSELSVIVGLTLLTILGTGDVKALVGVFAVAAFRLLPALRGILMGWTQIQNTVPSLEIIETGLADANETDNYEMDISFEDSITIRNLTYGYDAGAPVLDRFNCLIRKGEYVGFNGYSGVGKSTLFNLLLGFLKPQTGEVCVDAIPLTSENKTAWLGKIGYVQQDVFIFQGTLAENVALGYKHIDKEKVNRILKQVCLEPWAIELPQGIDTPMGEYGKRLSGGQRQRIGIARALYKEAEIILLDEATSALDNHTEMEINSMLAGLRKIYTGLTILSIAHRESSLSYCDRIITID